MRHLRSAVVLVSILLVAFAPSASAGVPRPTDPPPVPGSTMLTEVDVQPAALTEDGLVRLLDHLQANGVDVVSTGAMWSSLRPSPPPTDYQWSALDQLVTLARQRGMQVRLRVSGTPSWVHPHLTGVSSSDAIWYPPTGPEQLSAWSGFLTDLVSRYGDQVSAVEVWNEPNESSFWKPTPHPADYAALLRTSYLAVKSVAPGLTVTSGGISHNDVGFLSAYYTAAAAYADAESQHWFFDQLGLHPYCGDRSPDVVDPAVRYRGEFGIVDENFTAMTDMVGVVAAREGTAKRVWISEFGYSTDSTEWIQATPDTRRAYFLSRAYARARELGFVDGLGWYHSHPTPWDTAGYDILTATGETQTFAALARETGARPSTAAIRSGVGTSVSGVQRVIGSKVGLPGASASLELYVDGRRVASGTTSLAWDSRGTLNGSHDVQLAAWTADGTTYASAVGRVQVRN